MAWHRTEMQRLARFCTWDERSLHARKRAPATRTHGRGSRGGRSGCDGMVFAKHLREGVRRGRITCSVRIWTQPHVKAGGRYRMDEGQIVVDSIVPIRLAD